MTYLAAGRIHANADWSYKNHSHDFTEMMVMLGGQLEIFVRDEKFTTKAGDVIYYPPHAPHQERGIGYDRLDFIYFSFTGELKKQPCVVTDSSGHIRQLTSWLLEEQSSDYEHKDDILNALLQVIQVESKKACTKKTDPRVDLVRSLMKKRLAYPLQVTELAEHLHLSRAHFIRTYKHLTGHSPMEDFRRLRVETARNLLFTTPDSLKKISEKVGFESEYHFSRVFRKYMGVPPGYYRKNFSKG